MLKFILLFTSEENAFWYLIFGEMRNIQFGTSIRPQFGCDGNDIDAIVCAN